MKLSLSILANRLSGYEHIDTGNNNDLVLTGLRFISAENYQEDYVYIAVWDDLRKRDALPPYSLCIGGGEKYSVRVNDEHCSGIGFDSTISLFTLYNKVNGIFERYNDLERKLLTAIVNKAELPEILTIIGEVTGNPVILVDADMRVIASSKNIEENTDTFISETISSGIVNSDVLRIMKEEDMLHTLDSNRKPVLVNIPPVVPFYSANIFQGDERIASLSILCYRTNPEECMVAMIDCLVGIISGMIGEMFSAFSLRSTMLQKMFIDMLGGIKFDLKMVEHTISSLNWKVDDEYQVLMVELDKKDADGGIIKYTSRNIQNIFSDSIIIEMNASLMVLLHRTGNGRIDKIMADSFSRFLTRRNCKAGASMCFRDITLVMSHYKLASAALEKGECLDPDKKIYPYASYMVPHIMDLCAQSVDVVSLCCPEALSIFEYDRKNNTDFLKTLYVYLIFEKSLTVASKKLNVHRNTLVYRLSRITELFDVDLDNPAVRLHIIMSYIILHDANPGK
jgi:hypothetical protein